MWIFLDIVYFSPHNCYLLAVMWHFFVGRRDGVQSIHNRMGAAYIRLYDEPSTDSCLQERGKRWNRHL